MNDCTRVGKPACLRYTFLERDASFCLFPRHRTLLTCLCGHKCINFISWMLCFSFAITDSSVRLNVLNPTPALGGIRRLISSSGLVDVSSRLYQTRWGSLKNITNEVSRIQGSVREPVQFYKYVLPKFSRVTVVLALAETLMTGSMPNVQQRGPPVIKDALYRNSCVTRSCGTGYSAYHECHITQCTI